MMASTEGNETSTSETPISDSIRDAIKTGKDAIHEIGNKWSNDNDTNAEEDEDITTGEDD